MSLQILAKIFSSHSVIVINSSGFRGLILGKTVVKLGLYGKIITNKAGYTATEVACGWAGAIFEVTRPFRQ